MIKKTSAFFDGMIKLPFIPKAKHHSLILVATGAILILAGLALNTSYLFQKQMQYRSYLQRTELINNFYRHNPANVVGVIKYLDNEGNYSGTITVLGQGIKDGTCGTTKLGPCTFFWNVTEQGTDVHLRPHLLFTKMFENNTYSSMKQIDVSTFEIMTESKSEPCMNNTNYTVKIIGTTGLITSKDVATNCTEDGKLLKYSTTTIDKAI